MTFSGATFDSRQVRKGMLFVALKGATCDGRDYIPQALAKGAAGVVDGLEALHEVARQYRRTLGAKVIGVTGSAGKTTTKELLRRFLSPVGKVHATEGNFNNHIGLPMTILNCPVDADFLVVEMGTNHPGEIAALCSVAEPDVGVVTNIGTAHLEFFKTQDGIAAEKGRLLAAARSFAVIGADNVRREQLCAQCAGEAIVVDTAAEWMRGALAGVLPGEHNVANACLAYAVAERFGVTREQAVAALEGLVLPGARWRRVERDGVVFVDDTYNANPDSMVAALEAFASMPCRGRRIVVLGDMFELGEDSPRLHQRVFARARELGFDEVVAVGPVSSGCPHDSAYPDVDALKAAFGGKVVAGDSVLLKASHGMALGKLLD